MRRFDGRSAFSLSAEPVDPYGRGRIKGQAWHVCGSLLKGQAGDAGYECLGCGEVGWLVKPKSMSFAAQHEAGQDALYRLPGIMEQATWMRERFDAAFDLLTPEQRHEAYETARAVREERRTRAETQETP